MLAVQADGRSIKTIEGMADGAALHPLQQAFWDQHGLQCGFCTPGMIMQADWLLEQNPDPSEAEIREGISGNLCRCTGYVNIVKAIQQAAGTLARGRVGPGRRRRDHRRPGRLGRTGRGRLSGENDDDDDRGSAPPAPHQPRDRGHGPLASSARRTRASSAAPASTSTTSTCPASSGSTSSAARTPTRRSRASTPAEALKIPGVLAVITGKDLEGYKLHWMPTLAGDMQMVLPTDTVMYQSQEVAAVIATTKYIAADGVAAVLVDYEPLPVIIDPHKALEHGRLRPSPGPRRGQAEQPHLALGVGRQGGGRRRARGVRGPRQRGHLHPADPRRLDRDLRLRRRLGPGPQPADAAHDQPGAARDPDRPRARRGRRRPADLRAEHPGQDPRHRRRVRRQGAGLPGLRAGRRRLVPDRQAGQVDRGPLGEPPGRLVRPRLPHPRRARRRQGRQDHRR